MAGVSLNNLIKRFGEIQVIHGVDLKIEEGDFCVFVGPSGCGKSTLLRMIAGLEETTSGTIRIGDREVTDDDPSERGVAMVFQSYALYPHMTVEQNMGFGLKMNKVAKDEINKKVSEAADILKLNDYLKRKPKALSGGQRQRVAIGRAIVRGPDVFLFDEPLSNLDAELRVDMRVEIARLHNELDATMIYVTHDQVEAMTLADKIVVLKDGLIEQVGAPLHIYNDPDNQFVAGFIGSPAMNFLSCDFDGKSVIIRDLDKKQIIHKLVNKPSHDKITLGIRPENITIDKKGKDLTVDITEKLGGVSYVYLNTEMGNRLIVETKGEADVSHGDKVGISFKDEDARYFDAETGKRIR